MASVKTWPLFLLQFSLVSMGKAECPYPDFRGNFVLSSESRLKNEFPDNSDITVECSKGYEIKEGSSVVTCVNGNWSPVQLICQKKDCGVPVSSPHMTFTILDGTKFGARIKPECERRYDVSGSSYWQCLVDGWSGKSTCELIMCDVPHSIAHGEMDMPNKTPEMDDVIKYSCHENYTLVGNQSITCLEYDYSSPPPRCIRIECLVPEIEFGNQIEGIPPYFYKSQATFECWPGYRMKGSASAVCEATGWSALPVCEEIIKPNEENFTTKKATTTTTLITSPTTTATAASTTNTYFYKNQEEEFISPLLDNGSIVFGSLLALSVVIGVCLIILWRNNKHRGSYSTGEEQRTTKEELLLYQSV